MRMFVALLLAASVCGAAFAQTAPPGLTSDFVPPRGVSSPGPFGYIYWKERLLTATSNDGLTFTRTNHVITDQARSPNLVVMGDKLYVYYLTSGATSQWDTLAVAISVDQGKSWVFKYVEVKDGARVVHPNAPDVRVLADGRFRLSFNDNRFGPSVYYANSDDGIRFTQSGTVHSRTGRSGGMRIGSLTVPIGDLWHVYVRDGNSDHFGLVSYGVSSDGEGFKFNPESRIPFSEHDYPTSAVSLDDGRARFYGSSTNADGVRSYLTRDGIKFERESGVRLALDPMSDFEKDAVKDAAVVKLDNGSYFMVYVAGIR